MVERRVGCAAMLRRGAPLAHGSRLVDAQIQDDWLERGHLPLGAVKTHQVSANRHWLCYKRHEGKRLARSRRRFVFYSRFEHPRRRLLRGASQKFGCGQRWRAEGMPWMRLRDTSGVGHYDARPLHPAC